MNKEHEIQPLAFSLRDLSRTLGVSVSFLRLEIGRGKLQPTYLGRRVVVTRINVDLYLSHQNG